MKMKWNFDLGKQEKTDKIIFKKKKKKKKISKILTY
jgi:hypothetical protein